MRFVNVRELKSRTSEILRAAAGENIVVTNRGKPIAVLRGFDSAEFERAAFRPAAGVRETRVPYDAAVAGLPSSPPGPGVKPAWNPLKAIFWDYPELTDDAALGLKIQEARVSPVQDAFRWYLARFLERGRMEDTLRFFRLEEIRRIAPSLRISLRAAAKWAGILAGHGNA
jgi:prevent-host-death family protein